MNVTVTGDRKVSIALDDILGSFRTFGPAEPAYEIVRVIGPSEGNDVQVEVRVLESGEVFAYPLRDAVSDPRAP